MSTWTVYTTGADLSSLAMVFNGVAMLCQQTAWIWGMATVAATLSSLKGATMLPATGLPAASREGFGSPVVILFLAFLLTGPGLKGSVVVESSRTGAVTQVDNVPLVMLAVPSFGSTLVHDASAFVRTAFGATTANYDAMSASGNGFIDPMRRLLAARSAILRLGALNSEIQSVAAACLGGDSGADYAHVNNIVVRAGNITGTPTPPDVAVLGVPNTGIGLLLGQASTNTEAVVYDLDLSSSSMLSCSAAADKVKGDIEDALQSKDFARVVQVGVSGLDESDPASDEGFNAMAGQYTALRQWSTVVGNLAGGQQQANAELLNLLFAESLMSTLNCLKASDADRAGCEASMVQSVEIERSNLQAAAAAMPAVAFMGAFARQMLALVIALGPLVLLLAMFTGMGAWHAVRMMAQILLWPMLAVDVGAEIVNGLMLRNFSDFLATLSQQGYLSPLTTYGLYKELSLKIGVGSSIMASLPVIMGTIFGFSAVSGMRAAATAGAPRGDETGKDMAPSPTETAPLVRQTAPVSVTQGLGYSIVKPEGALDAARITSTIGTLARDTSHAMSTAETRQRTLTEAQSFTADWQKTFQRGSSTRFSISRDDVESLRKQYESALRTSTSSGVGTSASANKDNSNSSSTGVNGGFGVGMGSGGAPIRANLGVDAHTKTGATDTKSLNESGNTSKTAAESKALSMALNSEVGQRISRSLSSDQSRSFREAQSAAKRYEEMLSKTDTSTDSLTDSLKQGSSLVAAHAGIGASQMAYQMQANVDFQRFHADRGVKRDQDPTTRKYRELAEREMADDVAVTEAVKGSPRARDAVLRSRAAVLQYGDESAPQASRLDALRFLSDSVLAMTHMTVRPGADSELAPRAYDLADPRNRTGAEGLIPHDFDPVKAGVVRGAAPKPQRAATGGSTATARPASPPLTASSTHAALPEPRLGDTRVVDEAMSNEVNPLKDAAAAIQAEAQGRIADAKASGLAQDGPGTFKRAALNVADNAVDLTRDNAYRSVVRFGKEEPPKPSKPPKPDTPEGQIYVPDIYPTEPKL